MYSSFLGIFALLFLINHNVLTVASPLGAGFGVQQSQFGEGIRDWFFDMKDRIFGSKPPDVTAMLTQAKEDIERDKKLIEGFFINLSSVTFDPVKDWGFHVGHWYFIKKGSHPSDAVGMNSPNPALASPEFNWFDYSIKKDGSEFVRSTLPTPIEQPAVTTMEVSSGTTSQDKIIGKGTEPLNEKDNETYDRSGGAQSAEVLIPTN